MIHLRLTLRHQRAISSATKSLLRSGSRNSSANYHALNSLLLKSGQHDRNPVTTKHEKRSHANHLFAVSYGSFLGRYFGYYYSDVSEPACPDGTDTYLNSVDTPCVDPNAVLRGCYAYSVFGFNDAKCVDSTGGQGDHDFVVFKDGTPLRPNYWIAGEDPADCANNDGDCNLTIVKVVPVLSN